MSKYAHIKVTNEKKQSLIDALNGVTPEFGENSTLRKLFEF